MGYTDHRIDIQTFFWGPCKGYVCADNHGSWNISKHRRVHADNIKMRLTPYIHGVPQAPLPQILKETFPFIT